MRSFTAIAFVATTTAVIGQEIGFSGGSSISSGTNAVSNPNVNNGWQSDSSLFSSGEGAGVNTFNNVAGSSFTNVNANAAFKDNILNNPSITSVKGNSGWTANGDANELGPVQNLFGAASPVFRRHGDVVFADNHHQVQPQVVTPGFTGAFFAQPQFVPGYPHNAVVGGSIVRRSGDVVFADNHHQVNPHFVTPVFTHHPFIAGAFAKRSGDIVFGDNHHQLAPLVNPDFVRPVVAAVEWAAPVAKVVSPVVHPVAVRPAVAEHDSQKVTVVQNQA
ncbi:hypothetical protein GGI07_001763 [Coemansia sp. Benny D115]|nr:hypothetical protein GGI07_001763 [Coemansia sp. Benny D115]